MVTNVYPRPAAHEYRDCRLADAGRVSVSRHAARPFVVYRVETSSQSLRKTLIGMGQGTMAVALALFALLNLGDIVSTWFGLQSGLHEGNPLMSHLLFQFGFGALIAYKLLVVVAVSTGVVILNAFSGGVARATIWICNALVCAVVIMNVVQYFAR